MTKKVNFVLYIFWRNNWDHYKSVSKNYSFKLIRQVQTYSQMTIHET